MQTERDVHFFQINLVDNIKQFLKKQAKEYFKSDRLRKDNLMTTTIRHIRGLLLDISQLKFHQKSIFNPSLIRARDDAQKHGAYYYEVFKAFNQIFIHNGLSPVDLESHEQYMDFISIKVKTDHVISIHSYLKERGFDHQEQLDQLFRFDPIEEKYVNVLNSTNRTDFERAIHHNMMFQKFMNLFLKISDSIVEANPELNRIYQVVSKALDSMTNPQ